MPVKAGSRALPPKTWKRIRSARDRSRPRRRRRSNQNGTATSGSRNDPAITRLHEMRWWASGGIHGSMPRYASKAMPDRNSRSAQGRKLVLLDGVVGHMVGADGPMCRPSTKGSPRRWWRRASAPVRTTMRQARSAERKPGSPPARLEDVEGPRDDALVGCGTRPAASRADRVTNTILRRTHRPRGAWSRPELRHRARHAARVSVARAGPLGRRGVTALAATRGVEHGCQSMSATAARGRRQLRRHARSQAARPSVHVDVVMPASAAADRSATPASSRPSPP